MADSLKKNNLLNREQSPDLSRSQCLTNKQCPLIQNNPDMKRDEVDVNKMTGPE